MVDFALLWRQNTTTNVARHDSKCRVHLTGQLYCKDVTGKSQWRHDKRRHYDVSSYHSLTFQLSFSRVLKGSNINRFVVSICSADWTDQLSNELRTTRCKCKWANTVEISPTGPLLVHDVSRQPRLHWKVPIVAEVISGPKSSVRQADSALIWGAN